MAIRIDWPLFRGCWTVLWTVLFELPDSLRLKAKNCKENSIEEIYRLGSSSRCMYKIHPKKIHRPEASKRRILAIHPQNVSTRFIDQTLPRRLKNLKIHPEDSPKFFLEQSIVSSPSCSIALDSENAKSFRISLKSFQAKNFRLRKWRKPVDFSVCS